MEAALWKGNPLHGMYHMLKHALLILRRHRGTNHGCTGSIETEVYLNAQPWKERTRSYKINMDSSTDDGE